jgi:hypothetical protein
MKKINSITEDGSQARIKIILYGTFKDTVKREDIVLIHNGNDEDPTNKILGILRKGSGRNELPNPSRYRPDIIREKRKVRQKRSVAKKEAQVPTPLKGDKK